MAGPQPLITIVAKANPPAMPANFERLWKDKERKDFYAELKGPKWWTRGWKKSAQRGWVDVYMATEWKCIYCNKDLAVSTEALSESTEEHLVPRSLLEANGIDANCSQNRGACCAACNTLKSDSLPPAAHPCWKDRDAYLDVCRKFIARRRYEKFTELKGHVENALKRRAGV